MANTSGFALPYGQVTHRKGYTCCFDRIASCGHPIVTIAVVMGVYSL